MRTSWLTRLKVVILAAVVLTGGSGLPLLDALLYHTRASQANRAGATAGVGHAVRASADRFHLPAPCAAPVRGAPRGRPSRSTSLPSSSNTPGLTGSGR